MGRAQRNYEKEYKEQAVKLAKEIGREGTGSAQRDTVRVDEGVAGGAAGSGTGQPYPQRGDEPGGGDDGPAPADEGSGTGEPAAKRRE